MLANGAAAESTFEVGLATTPAAVEAALRLVHDCYVACGYMAPQPSGLRASFHHTLPSTRVFVARDAGRVVATVSLVADSTHGLPCDALYGTELDAMRAKHRRLAEVSALAVADDHRADGGATVRALVDIVARHAVRVVCADTLCITVNPRHERFYARRLGFQRFGPVRTYDAVNGAPAVPLARDLPRALPAARLKSLHRPRASRAIRPPRAEEVC